MYGALGLWCVIVSRQHVLAASMVEQISADIVGFEHTHQMWAFLHERYEPTGQSTYIAALRQEQLLRQDDSTVDDFYAHMSAVWRHYYKT